MRATWVGTIAFGLVTIPVSIYTATDRESGPELSYVHVGCGGRPEAEGSRVSTRYRCSHCEEYLQQGELNKGYVHGDELLTFTAEEIDALSGAKSRVAEVVEFVPAGDVPTELYGSLYYVAPTPPKRATRTGARPHVTSKAYQLLIEAMQRTGTVAVVSLALRNREHRAVLSVVTDEHGPYLTMRVLLWTAQLRATEFPNWYAGRWPAEELPDAEVDQAEALVRAMSGKFNRDSHVDPYAVALSELIERKAAERVPDNVSQLFRDSVQVVNAAG